MIENSLRYNLRQLSGGDSDCASMAGAIYVISINLKLKKQIYFSDISQR